MSKRRTIIFLLFSLNPIWVIAGNSSFTIAPVITYLLSDTGSSDNPHIIPPLSNTDKQDYLDAINIARSEVQDCGVYGIFYPAASLSWNDNLYKAAYEHTQDMTKSDTFKHNGSGGSSDWTSQVLHLGRGSHVDERLKHNGYSAWRKWGENITAGTFRDTAQKAVDSWLESDGHCSNLMDPDFTEVGMAHVYSNSARYSHYWTQNFGFR